jgi:N-acetyl-beta-hexosaminidase
MTRKNRTVNPKAGTLKQENRALRTNMKTITVKLIAFALFILVSIPNMSFVQDGSNLAVADNKTTSGLLNMDPDSCCVIEKSGSVRPGKGRIKLVIPSIEMIRKSDSEATSNLVYSLRENKLKALKPLIVKSDADISNRFRKETSLDLKNSIHAVNADSHIVNLFAAENLRYNTVTLNEKADADIQASFIVENVGITVGYTNIVKADSEIARDFTLQTLTISLPSVDQFSLADKEIKNQMQQIADIQSVSVLKNRK